MKTIFADSNIFLRFFTKDDQGHHKRAAALLRGAEAGELALVSGPPVFFVDNQVLRLMRSAA